MGYNLRQVLAPGIIGSARLGGEREMLIPSINKTSTGFASACVQKSPPFLSLRKSRFLEVFVDRLRCSKDSCFVNSSTAVYIRVSTKEQRTDSQLRELSRYCKQRGWKKVDYYVDKISGEKSTRPELDRMMKEARKGGVQRQVSHTRRHPG